jgi:hypothetical protein
MKKCCTKTVLVHSDKDDEINLKNVVGNFEKTDVKKGDVVFERSGFRIANSSGACRVCMNSIDELLSWSNWNPYVDFNLDEKIKSKSKVKFEVLAMIINAYRISVERPEEMCYSQLLKNFEEISYDKKLETYIEKVLQEKNREKKILLLKQFCVYGNDAFNVGNKYFVREFMVKWAKKCKEIIGTSLNIEEMKNEELIEHNLKLDFSYLKNDTIKDINRELEINKYAIRYKTDENDEWFKDILEKQGNLIEEYLVKTWENDFQEKITSLDFEDESIEVYVTTSKKHSYTFMRLVYDSSSKSMAQPVKAEFVAKLRNQYEYSKVFGSWVVDTGVLVLMKMSCKVNNSLRLVFLPNNFEGESTEFVIWELNKDIICTEDDVYSDFNHLRNILVISCGHLITLEISSDFMEAKVKARISLSGVSGLAIDSKCTNCIVSFNVENGEKCMMFLDPSTLKELRTLKGETNSSIVFAGNDIIISSSEGKYYVMDINDQNNTFVRLDEDNIKGFAMLNGKTVAIISYSDKKYFYAYFLGEDKKLIKDAQEHTNGENNPLKCVTFAKRSIEKYGFSGIERLSHANKDSYPVRMVKTSIMFPEKEKALQKYVYDNIKEGELRDFFKEDCLFPIEFVLAPENDSGSHTHVSDKLKLPEVDSCPLTYVFNMLSAPRLWFTINECSKDSVEIGRAFPFNICLRSIMKGAGFIRVMNITFADLYDGNGYGVLSSLTGLQFTNIQPYSCAVGYSMSTISNMPDKLVCYPTLYLKQKYPFNDPDNTAKAMICSILVGNGINVFNFGSANHEYVLESFKLLFKTLADEKIFIKQGEFPRIAIICDLGLMHEKTVTNLRFSIANSFRNSIITTFESCLIDSMKNSFAIMMRKTIKKVGAKYQRENQQEFRMKFKINFSKVLNESIKNVKTMDLKQQLMSSIRRVFNEIIDSINEEEMKEEINEEEEMDEEEMDEEIDDDDDEEMDEEEEEMKKASEKICRDIFADFQKENLTIKEKISSFINNIIIIPSDKKPLDIAKSLEVYLFEKRYHELFGSFKEMNNANLTEIIGKMIDAGILFSRY